MESVSGGQVTAKPKDVGQDRESRSQPERVAVLAGQGNRPPGGVLGLGQLTELSQARGEG
jgi:hypothetical protein